jgi:ubiquinone/menaquinone biosynthesis C-methylase UbiE
MQAVLKTGKRLIAAAVRRVFPVLHRKWATRRRFDKIAERTSAVFIPFMNYGYVPFDDAEKESLSRLPPQKEIPDQQSMQLYHHVAGQVSLEGREVLDVGCGRGGGSYFIKQYLKARTVIGVDISGVNIERCQRAFVAEGLSFRQADAEELAFKDGSFDAVVNVESSHNYPRIDNFFREVRRVLRSGGFFLYADLRSPEGMEQVKEKMKAHGLEITQSQDITANVVESLRLRSQSREALLGSHAKDEREYREFSERVRLVGSKAFRRFETREEVYMSFVAQRR